MNTAIAVQGLHLDVSPEGTEKLVSLGYNPTMGARPLRRVIQEQLEDRVADFYLDNPEVKQLQATVVDDAITVTAESVAPATVTTEE